jgi:hypothetical protein
MKSNSFFHHLNFMIKKLNKLNLTFVEPNSKLFIKETSLFLNKSILKLNSFLINLTQITCNTEFIILKISEKKKIIFKNNFSINKKFLKSNLLYL